MDSNLSGAQCPRHPGAPAVAVCQRCGNFMCTVCTAEGTQVQCPSCRALIPSSAFPFNASADVGALWDHVFTSFKREWQACVVAGLIFLSLSLVGAFVSNLLSSAISALLGLGVESGNALDWRAMLPRMAVGQMVGAVVNVVVQGFALVGLYRVLLDALLGRKADIGRMFSNLDLVPRFVGLQVLLGLVVSLPMLLLVAGAAGLGFWVSGMSWNDPSGFRELFTNPALIPIVASFVVLIFLAVILSLPVTLFASPELIVGNCGPVEALSRAWALGRGQRWRVVGYSLLSGAIAMVGMLACCVGLLPAFPLAYMILLALFLALRNSSSLPPIEA